MRFVKKKNAILNFDTALHYHFHFHQRGRHSFVIVLVAVVSLRARSVREISELDENLIYFDVVVLM